MYCSIRRAPVTKIFFNLKGVAMSFGSIDVVYVHVYILVKECVFIHKKICTHPLDNMHCELGKKHILYVH